MLRQGIGPLATRRTDTAATASTQLVFDSRAETDEVRNAIGNIAQNTSVAQLEALQTIPRLLAEMLQITSATPVPTDFGVTLVGVSEPAVQVGSTMQTTATIRFDRGAWSEAASSPPYGRMVGPSIQFAMPGASFTFSLPTGTQSRVTNQEFTSTAAVPAQLSTWALDVTVTHAAGDPFVNDDGVELTSVPAGTLTASSSVRSFAPVFLGDTPNTNVTAGNSGLVSTLQVFEDTTEIVVANHTHSDTIALPKAPLEYAQYEEFFRQFVVQPGGVYTVEEMNMSVGAVSMKYYVISVPAERGVTDIRIRV